MLDADTVDATGELAEMLHAAAIRDPRDVPARFSLLKQMSLSPAHYREACQRDQDDSLASRLGAASTDRKEVLRFGNAAHAMLFNTGEVAVFGSRRAGKAWESFQADAASRGCVEILSTREHAIATGVVGALRANPTAMRLLFEDTIVEQRIDWTWSGKAIRSTPDARGPRHIVDLKTAVSSEPGAFARQGTRLFYHAQAALYCQAIEAAGEPPPNDCYVIAVEKTRPYAVTVMRFDEDALDMGRKLIRLWFERLLLCESTGVWPEYVPSPAIADFSIHRQHEPFTVEIDGERLEV